MMRKIAAAVLALVLVAACGGEDDASGPPEIVYGRDICVECNMIISEPGHAAAYRLADGTEKKFDGVGEMLLHAIKTGDLDTTATKAWVHDIETEEWIAAADAWYVMAEAVTTPMGHGIVAFSDLERASVFAGEIGVEPMTWHDVRAIPAVDGRLAGHSHDHDHDPGEGDHDMTDHDTADHDHDMADHDHEAAP